MTFEALTRTGQEIRFFLRDDDIDVDEETLVALLDICNAHRVPITLAAIPGRLTNECAALVRKRRSHNPEAIEVHQHGWMHVSREREGKKGEFGPSRTLDQQRADIAAGRAHMDEIFGDAWFPAFTPPWNRYTADTRRVLDELGFAVLSADGARLKAPGQRFHEIPVTLDIFRWKGDTTLRPREELVAELLKQIECRQNIGILLHHKVMDRAAFAFLDWLLGELVRYPEARFETFQTLSSSRALEAGSHAR